MNRGIVRVLSAERRAALDQFFRHLPLFCSLVRTVAIMSDEPLTGEQVAEMRKKRTFRKFTFRGVDLDKLLDLSMEVRWLDIHTVPSICYCTNSAMIAHSGSRSR